MCGFAELLWPIAGCRRFFDFALMNIRKKLEILHFVQDDRWRALPRHSRGSSSQKKRYENVSGPDTSGVLPCLWSANSINHDDPDALAVWNGRGRLGLGVERNA